jgi:hypothetical protein
MIVIDFISFYHVLCNEIVSFILRSFTLGRAYVLASMLLLSAESFNAAKKRRTLGGSFIFAEYAVCEVFVLVASS